MNSSLFRLRRVMNVLLILLIALSSQAVFAEESFYSYQLSIEGEFPAMNPGQQYLIPVRVKNTSPSEWKYSPDQTINLSYHWLDEKGAEVEHDGERTTIPQGFREGVLKAKINAPAKTGKYICELDLVHENVSWFAAKGAKPLRVSVTIGGKTPPGSTSSKF
ncbi:MAG: hypothetical protein HQK59_07160 [Deltaproteobacteria bacterium]|nr:hypothetical protein [Deltaproteobacteria bacterium]